MGCAFLRGEIMKVIDIEVDKLIPYEKNPRKNDKAVKFVAKSIEEFGFKVPIVVDKNNVVICGHTRLKAVKKLGWNSVPCLIADDLTDEQIKAFRLADNKVSEQAEWDFDLLDEEINEILNLDMGEFGFEFEEPSNATPKEKKNERLRTDEAYNLRLFDPERCVGKYQIPTLEPCYKIPSKMIGFNYAMSSDEYDATIHFYLDDYQFERIWNQPDKYIDILSQFDAVLTPHFSLYLDMSESLKIYNVFRTRLLGQVMQDCGMDVIPLVYWGDERSFDYCFDGLPEKSVLSTYTMGVNDPKVWVHWKRGMDELIKRKKPKTILLYGNGLTVDYDFGDTKVIYYQNEVTKRMNEKK